MTERRQLKQRKEEIVNKFLRRLCHPGVMTALAIALLSGPARAAEPADVVAAVSWFCHDEATIKKYIATPAPADQEFIQVAARSRICGMMTPPQLMVPLRYLGAVVNPNTGNSVDIWEMTFHPGNTKGLAWKKQRGLPMFTSSRGKEFREKMLQSIEAREEAAKGSSI